MVGLVSGALIGGVIGGLIGVVLGPRVSRRSAADFADDSVPNPLRGQTTDTRSGSSGLGSGSQPELSGQDPFPPQSNGGGKISTEEGDNALLRAKETLEAKIIELNASIQDMRTQLLAQDQHPPDQSSQAQSSPQPQSPSRRSS